MKTGLLCAIVLVACLRGECQLILNAGDTWTYQFNALPLTGSTNSFVTSPQGTWEFTLNASTLQNGDALIYEMFENSAGEAPICSGTVTVGSPLTLTCNVLNAWQDQQGTIRLRMTAGSVAVERVRLQAIVSGPSLSSYEVRSASFVPGPGPRLTITPAGNLTAQISWTTNFAEHNLEYATNLPTTVWSPVTNSVTTNGAFYSVTIGTSANQRVYRLHKPD